MLLDLIEDFVNNKKKEKTRKVEKDLFLLFKEKHQHRLQLVYFFREL